jgi:hypothetical protein
MTLTERYERLANLVAMIRADLPGVQQGWRITLKNLLVLAESRLAEVHNCLRRYEAESRSYHPSCAYLRENRVAAENILSELERCLLPGEVDRG